MSDKEKVYDDQEYDLGGEIGPETEDNDQEEVAPEDETDGDVEGEEEEETDEGGVPLKNRLAEAQRKLAAAEARANTYKDLLDNHKTKPKEEAKEQTAAEILQSLEDSEFEAVGIDPKVARVLRKSQRREAEIAIANRIKAAEDEARTVQQQRAQFFKDREASVVEVSDELSEEFGSLIKNDPRTGKPVYDQSSEIYKRTNEIYSQSPRLQQIPDGPAIAARKAELELIKEKYGHTRKKKGSAKGERLKGLGSKVRGGSGKVKNSRGKWYRKLSDEEYDKLPKKDKDAYDLWETMERNK